MEISYLILEGHLKSLKQFEEIPVLIGRFMLIPVLLIKTHGSMEQVNRTFRRFLEMVVPGSFILSYVSKGCLEHLRMQ